MRNFTEDLIYRQLFSEQRAELEHGLNKFGRFKSPHECYAVILEELDEFWDSVKANEPDETELLQIAALAIRGVKELREQKEKANGG